MEVAPGIHRIESILGPRPFSQYLVRGERTLLVIPTVTAQRRTQNLMEVPISVTAVDEEKIEMLLLGGQDVKALSGRVP